MATQKEILKAMLLDSIRAGKGGMGPGGASGAARDRNRAEFTNSHLGRLLAGTPQFEQMFEQKYYGGAIPFQYGQTPDPRQAQRWFEKMGLGEQQPKSPQRPLLPTGRGGSMISGIGQVGSQVGNQGGLSGLTDEQLNSLFILATMGDEAARNAAVKKRETEIRAGMDGLYDRTMGRVENFNKVAEEDRREQAFETQRAVEARNAVRGLSNATNDSAFQLRNDDLMARDLRRLGEERDERAIRHDIALTGNKNDFVERITDHIPNTANAIQLAQQLGLAGGGGQQQAGLSPQILAALQGIGQRPGMPQAQGQAMTPWGAVQQADPSGGLLRSPISMGVMNPLAPLMAQQGAVNAFVPQPQSPISNRGVQRRDPEFLKLLPGVAAANARHRNSPWQDPEVQRIQWQQPDQQGILSNILSAVAGQRPKGKYGVVKAPRRRGTVIGNGL